MINIKRAVMLLAALSTIAPWTAMAAAGGDTLEKIRKTGIIVLGVREASYPMSYRIDDTYVGYHMDICQRIVDRVKALPGMGGVTVRYVPVTSQDRIGKTVDGTVDLECGSTTNNLERQRQVAFAPTTYVTIVRLAVRKDSGIRGLSQLRGAAVVTTKGSTSVRLVAARQQQAGSDLQALYGTDHSQSFEILESGTAKAFAMDDNLLAGLIATSARPNDFAIIGPPISVEPIAIMLRKDDAAFKALVDDTVIGLMKSREIHKLYQRWFVGPIPPNDVSLNLPMSELVRQQFDTPDWSPAEAFMSSPE